MIVEYAPHGNLRDFLRERRPKTSGYEMPVNNTLGLDQTTTPTYKELVKFAYQVARGMDYLSSRLVSAS